MPKLILISLILLAFAPASISRLYIGESGGQLMAGVDTRIKFGPFFVGGDIKTVIRKMVFNEQDKLIGFLPDRTDYKTAAGIAVNGVEIEYAHTCYHRVISDSNLSFYADNINPGDTDTITVKIAF
ncbi:MAG: hypothetical protein LBQ83_03270 [Candidatus Margulisbacteria bacterium]|jgi:hypothetical protein|nr:hypothetical protein [Candidatus Margulisiibacteriota bacterium]